MPCVDTRLLKLEQAFNPAPLIQVHDKLFSQHRIELWLKRDDLLHPVISGNKWRKLKYILNHALQSGCNELLSMGGAYSNHLHALAYAGYQLGLSTQAYIRGEEPQSHNATLNDLSQWGMQLHFISRSAYKNLRNYKNWQDLPGIQRHQYWIPEGGSTSLAMAGVAELAQELPADVHYLCVPCGTGITLAGIIKHIDNKANVIGFAACKNADTIISDLQTWLTPAHHYWHLNLDYHLGGFAKITPELIAFMQQIEQQTGIPLEPIYTGKMLYGIYDLVRRNYFPAGSKIVAIHTGGLQGNRGFQR
ncbi:1-aminocyclopropane-1-carboxylate deaminase/D-cysteine desulfhydrase [Methylocucumis oryzae]|uniref:1-aminocyclopropane-1-carboxylate deaminase n=1 Tax=Methylocucumis oryzae TaxID=1632867 RepID=A0A0F3IL91_9GAMM|nr:pyridoxal-phosphate dependent enzyme [Methylocucumis oryzae]KJV07486.1 1-aminocyclopropane-1-carboxylate deaminase [Methylocucumis oryzae]